MRLYRNCQELMTESYRDLREMGIEVTVPSMQDKQEPFKTREILNYSYCLLNTGSNDVTESINDLFMITKGKDWCVAEFADRVAHLPVNPGSAWGLRKDIWEEFLIKNNGKFSYTYNERMRDQLHFLINEMKAKPNTRQAYLAIWDPTKDLDLIDAQDRVPCSLGYQFLIRKNPQGEDILHINYTMRSGDIATHFGNDVFLAILLQKYVAKHLSIKPGNLYHSIFSFHCYEKDWYLI